MTKQWVPVQIPLAAGLATGGDARATSPPQFDMLRDAEFEEPGGLQTRKPYADLSLNIFGGGTLSAIRRIYENGDELLCFTSTALYSWSAQLSVWVLKAEHLAIKVAEVPKFVSTGDQVSCDRAELNGVIVYAWEDNGNVYAAAVDKTTAAVIVTPYIVSSGTRPKLVALSTRIMLFHGTGTDLLVYAINPAVLSAGQIDVGNTVALGTDYNLYYDVCKQAGADVALFASRRVTTTSYTVGKVTSALVVTTSTKARTCDGPIAVSSEPLGASVQVIRGNGTNLQGDYITVSTLADVTTAQAVGTCSGTLYQIAAAHRTLQNSSAYRCYAFWHSAESAGATDWTSKYNWVDTAGTIGTQANFIRRLGIASRAFAYNGSVYVWGAFAGESSFSGANPALFRAQLQNTYFLYRDDATYHAKAAAGDAGGYSSAIGRLPAVQFVAGTTAEYAWCGTQRRIIPLGANQAGYADRGPLEIRFAFDSNEARRTARLGRTLYITGGEILQYDGRQLTEVGFHVVPWYFAAIEVGTGNLADGVYAFKPTWRWENAQGEIDRSSSATAGSVTIAGGPNGVSIVSWIPLYTTHKTANAPAVEVWRTAVAPTADAPFFLVSSKDPAVTSNPQRYVANDPSSSSLATFNDEYADATATTKENNPENGSVLENLAPPAASIIVAAHDRLFLAGIAGDPDRVWYSKQRADGEVAAFHDALTISVPPSGGNITALAFLNETLVVFRETAVYVLPGQGFDNLGGGQNYGPASKVPGDVGAISAESVLLTPMGVFFKSSKGFYNLTPRWTCEYIGLQVNQFDSDTVCAAHVVESQHQVRVLTDARMLVLDYRINEWSEWTIASGAHATMWQGVHHCATSDVIKGQLTTYTGVTYGLDAETAWIKLNDLQGAGSVRWLSVLGEYRGAHKLRIRLARDYVQDGSGNWVYYQDGTWTPSPTTIGSVEQVRIGPKIPKCEAIKVRITAVHPDGTSVPNNEACKLTGLALEVGIDQGINRRLPAAQKA